MNIFKTDIPFGIPILYNLFDELIEEKSPFCLKKYYNIERIINYGSYISFLGGYVPKYLHANGLDINENTTLKEFNKQINDFPKEIIEKTDCDLIIPIAIRSKHKFSSILGHFTTVIIHKRSGIYHLEIFDPKNEDLDGKFKNLLYLLYNCKLNIYSCELYYCNIQKTEDIVNCGYYMFKIIYNYLLISNNRDVYDGCFAINPDTSERNISEIFFRLLNCSFLDPYPYENIKIDEHTINFLTLNERNYLYECVKKERLRHTVMLM